jgi:hypothetical protein
MKMFSWGTLVVIAVSLLGACKQAEVGADVMGGRHRKPGIDQQNGGGCNTGTQTGGTQTGGTQNSGNCKRPGIDAQNTESSVPFDPDWEMANWRVALCRCAGHDKDPDARKVNYIKGLCYTEMNDRFDNRVICAKQCTEIMDKAGGVNAKGCPNADDSSAGLEGKLPAAGGAPVQQPSSPAGQSNDPAYGGASKPTAPVPPSGPVTRPGGEVQK